MSNAFKSIECNFVERFDIQFFSVLLFANETYPNKEFIVNKKKGCM